jgi:hypothetical protein
VTIQTTTSRATQLLTWATTAAPPRRRTRSCRPGALDHPTALAENGFTVFPGLFSTTECAELATELKAEAGIRDGATFTKVDAANCFRTARELLLEGRIVDAARASIGVEVRFLQVSDLQYRHETSGWHRDSVHRAADASAAPDWSDPETPYQVVKAVLYLEADGAAMGFMAGSHRSPIEMDHAGVKRVEAAGKQMVIAAGADPNRRSSRLRNCRPVVWPAEVGDVLIFDERIFNAGRRVERGRVTPNRGAPTFTLSLVFGADNHHSERLYSYFRYARKELPYRELPPALRAVLSDRGLVLSQGWTNFYRRHPQELRYAYLRDDADRQPLIEQFSRAVP